jgi:soluble cytochrome b562
MGIFDTKQNKKTIYKSSKQSKIRNAINSSKGALNNVLELTDNVKKSRIDECILSDFQRKFMKLWYDLDEYITDLDKIDDTVTSQSIGDKYKNTLLITQFIDTYIQIDNLMTQHTKLYFTKYKLIEKSILVEHMKLNKFNIRHMEKHSQNKYLTKII